MSQATGELDVTNALIAKYDKESKTVFGFWVYLMTDCVLFASLFAVFAVLRHNTYGGPTAQQLFSLPYVMLETMALLTSSFTAGLALLSAQRKHKNHVLFWFGVTFLLGLTFLILELSEFSRFVATTSENTPKAGRIKMYTSGCPQAQIKLTYIIILPPAPEVKKCMPSVRSSAKSVSVAVRIGKAKATNSIEPSTLQTNIGIFIKFMPLTRILRIVTIKLIDASKLPTPAICKLHIQ